jgi:hypothetical protein
LHCSTVVISVADKVDRLEACTALLPPEAAELDAQQQAAAVAPVALREAAEEVKAEPDAQQKAVAAAAPVARREVAEEVEAEPDARQEAAEESVAQQRAVEVVEPDAQQEAAAEESVARRQAVEVEVVEPNVEAAKSDAQQEAVAGPQDARRQEEVPVAQSGERQPEPWVESVETAAVRLWCRATSSFALGPA